MTSNLFLKILNKIKCFLIEQKIFCFIIFIVVLIGIIFGIYSGITLNESLTLDDITDALFLSFLDGETSFFYFLCQRIIFLVLPVLILIFLNHWIFCPVIIYFCFARAYFFAFNLAILFCKLNIFGLIYVILVALPCYLLYCLLMIPCYVILLKRMFLYRQFKTSKCENMIVIQNLFKTIFIFVLLILIVVLYESIFLFVIFNKYIFTV